MQSRLVSGDEGRITTCRTSLKIPPNGPDLTCSPGFGPQLNCFEGMVGVRAYAIGVAIKDKPVGETMSLKPIGERQATALSAAHTVKFILKLDADLGLERLLRDRFR